MGIRFKRLIGTSILVVSMTASLLNIETVKAKDVWPKGPGKISAESAIVMDVNSGVILYEKNSHDEHYPASITKIMTTLLCLENSSLQDTVTYSREAVYGIETGSSHIWLEPGEKMSMEDSLYGIMLMSANEACLGVAEHVGGSVKKFVKMMNKKAKELGCQNTHFNNPNGLFDKNHYTSAYDMALIARAAYQNETFRKITGTSRYDTQKTNKNAVRNLYNHHEMLYPHNYPKYGYEYCVGGKTGYTDIARWTLVTYAKKGDMELLTVVMKTAGPPPGEPNEYTDTIKLLNYCFENYEKKKMAVDDITKNEEGESGIFTKFNPFFNTDESNLKLDTDGSVILPKGVKVSKVKQSVTYNKDIELKEGDNKIGSVKYTYAGKVCGQGNIIYTKAAATKRLAANFNSSEWIKKAMEEATKSAFPWKKVITITAIIVFGIGVIVLCVFSVLMFRNSRRKGSLYKGLSEYKDTKRKFRFFHKKE